MEFSYFEPAPALRRLVSSYYFVSFPCAVTDIMRAEIANARFILSGAVNSDLSGEGVLYEAPYAMLSGPTYHWSRVECVPNTSVFGAAITPLGWCRLFGFSAYEAADKNLAFQDCIPADKAPLVDAIFAAPDKVSIVRAADNLFSALVSDKWAVNEEFIDIATDWIVDPEPNEIEHLRAACDLSDRQIQRLCQAYFGSSPKKLHRKFRALHAANRLTWNNLSDWREVARAAYYDQAHFIREFKQFNGRTPQEFMNGPHILVRVTLQERLKINHASPFSLVG